jgi:flagellar biosynthesis protein FlhG
VDADLGTANADVVMNVQSRFDLSHVLSGERSIDEITVNVGRGLQLVVGASGLASVADLTTFKRESLINELSRLEDQSDFILLDCGAGVSRNVLALAHSADELLVVTTPEPASLTDAYALVKIMSRAPNPPPIGLIVNQCISPREGRQVAERLISVATRFLGIAPHFVGQVVQDQHVRSAVRLRVPFVVKYPGCPASSCVTALAERVGRSVSSVPPKPGFFRRAVRLFY